MTHHEHAEKEIDDRHFIIANDIENKAYITAYQFRCNNDNPNNTIPLVNIKYFDYDKKYSQTLKKEFTILLIRLVDY